MRISQTALKHRAICGGARLSRARWTSGPKKRAAGGETRVRCLRHHTTRRKRGRSAMAVKVVVRSRKGRGVWQAIRDGREPACEQGERARAHQATIPAPSTTRCTHTHTHTHTAHTTPQGGTETTTTTRARHTHRHREGQRQSHAHATHNATGRDRDNRTRTPHATPQGGTETTTRARHTQRHREGQRQPHAHATHNATGRDRDNQTTYPKSTSLFARDGFRAAPCFSRWSFRALR